MLDWIGADSVFLRTRQQDQNRPLLPLAHQDSLFGLSTSTTAIVAAAHVFASSQASCVLGWREVWLRVEPELATSTWATLLRQSRCRRWQRTEQVGVTEGGGRGLTRGWRLAGHTRGASQYLKWYFVDN